MLRALLLTVGQIVGAALVLVGLYWLLGLAWTVTVAGVALFALCLFAEVVGLRSTPRRAAVRTPRVQRWRDLGSGVPAPRPEQMREAS